MKIFDKNEDRRQEIIQEISSRLYKLFLKYGRPSIKEFFSDRDTNKIDVQL
jgi:hypothetical protein